MSARSVIAPPLTITFAWISSDENVAVIDQQGRIVPKGKGVTTISYNTTYWLFGRVVESFIEEITVEVINNVFHFAEGIDITDADVKFKALKKMNEYYANKEEVRDFIDNNKTCIFAFEGLGDPSLKKDDNVPSDRTNTSEIHPIWLYNAMMIVTEGKKIKYITRRASTLPDKETAPSNTTIKEGVYTYKTGNHGLGYEDGKPVIIDSTYIALKPTDDPRVAWYKNSEGFFCANSWGTNLHAGTALFHGPITYYNSEGCQIVHFKDYVSFGKAVGFLKDDNSLIDISSISSLGSDLHNTIGAVGDEKID